MIAIGSAPEFSEIPGLRDSCIKEVQDAIDSWPLPDEAKAAFRVRAFDLLTYRISGTANNMAGMGSIPRYAGGQIGHRTWLVKTDDLNLLSQLAPAAMAIVTFLSVPTAPFAVMACGLAFSAVTIASKFRAKKISLDVDDYKILMSLKQAGPSTPTRIAEILSGLHIFGAGVWTEGQVIEKLTELKELPEADGIAVKVVNESSDGRWSVAGF